MITLKKSFELQNYLKTLLEGALTTLAYNENITCIKQEHLRSKAYKDGEDETIVKPKRTDLPYKVMEIVDFSCDISNQIEKLTLAINEAKHSNSKDYDGMIAVNNMKRKVLSRLVAMSSLKPSEIMRTGQAYKFNGEGNQVPYSYDIKEIATIDFDRNSIKAIISRLRKELDENSTAIDTMQLETMVDFNTVYEVGDALEDAIQKYLDNK